MFNDPCLTISSASAQNCVSVVKILSSGSSQTAYRRVDLRLKT
jgi:hypothetical protein